MKTLTKLTPFLLAVIAIVIASCKGKTGSGTSKDSAESTVTSSASASASAGTSAAKSGSVIDSLNITDADEKKVCTAYDEYVTAYLDELKELYADTSKQSNNKKDEIEKKYEEKIKALQPDIDNLRKHYQTNPEEGMKFLSFQGYEGKRIMTVVSQYSQAMIKKYSVPAKN